MAFVTEKIREEDTERFLKFGLTAAFSEKPLRPNRWAIDRERNLIMIPRGGQGSYHSEVPLFYTLIWDGIPIGIHAYCRGEGSYSSGVKMWWKITQITAPLSFQDREEELIQIIKEALEVDGDGTRHECVIATTFDYVCRPSFYNYGVLVE